jgi:hypothetical protein
MSEGFLIGSLTWQPQTAKPGESFRPITRLAYNFEFSFLGSSAVA